MSEKISSGTKKPNKQNILARVSGHRDVLVFNRFLPGICKIKIEAQTYETFMLDKIILVT